LGWDFSSLSNVFAPAGRRGQRAGEPVLDFSQYRFVALALISRARARCWSLREQSRRPGQLAVSIGRVYRVGSVLSRRTSAVNGSADD